MDWYQRTKLGKYCGYDTHCSECDSNGSCDICDTIDGRWIEAVNEYASTCDWCGEMCMHSMQHFDPITELGYCDTCYHNCLPESLKAQVEAW